MPIVTEIKGPNAPAETAQTQSSQAVSRERAIRAYMGEAQQTPQASQRQDQSVVRNQNQVDPMELHQMNQGGNSETQVAQADAVEETLAPQVKPPEAKADEAISPQYAALARREKALRAQRVQQDQAFKAREDALKAREEALRSPSASPSIDSSKMVSLDDLAKDPYGALARAGLTYDQLVEQAMNAPKAGEVQMMTTVNQLQEEIKALRQELDGTSKSVKEQEGKAREGAVRQIRADVNQLVFTDPAFETIKVTGQQEEVVKLIQSVYDKGMGEEYPQGTLLDPHTAAQLVEDEIAENLYQWSSKASKIANRFKPQAPAAQTAQKTVAQQNSSNGQMKTLTNQMNGSPKLSSRERAILAAEGKLSK